MSGKPSGAACEVIRFQTETGSIYEVARTTEGMFWQRVSASFASGVLRDEGARLLAWPDVRMGARCPLLSEPLVPGHPRLVWTSEVVAIVERQPAARNHQAVAQPNWLHLLHVGETVARLLGSSLPMTLVVSRIEGEFTYCGDPRASWMFDRDTGVEVGEELGWGPQSGLTGSLLVPAFEKRVREQS